MMRAHLDHTAEEQAWIDQHVGVELAPHLGAVLMGVSAVGFNVHGKDISSYQVVGNFGEGGRQFGIAKASEGTSYADPHFAGNRQSARTEGLAAFGIYDFARPGRNSADAEFAKYMSVVGSPAAGEFAVLDYEVPPWNEGWACRWADLAHQAGFRKVLFYSYAGMLAPNPTGQIVQHFDDLWIAAYGATPPHGDRWKRGPYGWALWQHTDGQASVHGNDGSTDCSAFFGSVDDLRAWVGGAVPPPPPPQPQPPPVALRDTLHAGEELHRGDLLHSTSGRYLFAMQGDGHPVLYDTQSWKPLWATPSSGADKFAMQGDDNVVAYAGARAIWSSGTQHKGGTGHCRFVVQDDGNLVIYRDLDNVPVWDRHRGVLR